MAYRLLLFIEAHSWAPGGPRGAPRGPKAGPRPQEGLLRAPRLPKGLPMGSQWSHEGGRIFFGNRRAWFSLKGPQIMGYLIVISNLHPCSFLSQNLFPFIHSWPDFYRLNLLFIEVLPFYFNLWPQILRKQVRSNKDASKRRMFKKIVLNCFNCF